MVWNGAAWTPGSTMNRRFITRREAGYSLNLFPRFLSRVAVWVACPAPSGFVSRRCLRSRTANCYKHGQAAEAREDYDAAFDFYQKAMAKSPADVTFKAAFHRVRVSDSAMHMAKGRTLMEGGDEQGALVEFLHASEIDPAMMRHSKRFRSSARTRKPRPQARPA